MINIYDILDSSGSQENPDIPFEKIEAAQVSCPDRTYSNMEKELNRQWFSELKSLQFLITFILNYVDESGVLFISQIDERLTGYYHNKVTVYNKIQKLIKLGALYDLKTEHTFLGPNPKAKHYYANTSNLYRLMKIYKRECKKHRRKDEAAYYQWNLPNPKPKIRSRDTTQLQPIKQFRGFCSNMKIPLDVHTEEQVYQELYRKYPYLAYYQELAESLSEDLPQAEKIRFCPNIHIKPYDWEGQKIPTVTKIGIRATNPVCSKTSFQKQKKKAERNGNHYEKQENIEYREDYLDRVLGDDRDEQDEFDVHASIATISHAKFFPEDGMGNLKEDPYKKMFYLFKDELRKLEPSINGWEDARDYFKKLFMRLFNSSSPDEVLARLIWHQMELLEKDSNAVFDVNLLKYDKSFLLDMFTKWKNAVSQYCGDYGPHSTEVYFEESCIYLEVRAILAERGIRVVQVYDCFYFRHNEMPEDIEDIIAQAEKQFRERIRFSFEQQKAG